MRTFTSSGKIILTSALLVISALYQASAFAEDSSTQKQVSPPTKVVKPADSLTLSAAQRETFRNILKERYENIRNGKEVYDEIQKLTESSTYDEKQVRALIQKYHQAAEKSMVKTSREMHNFYKTLSPEQKEQLDEIRDEMKERRRDDMREHKKESDETRNKK